MSSNLIDANNLFDFILSRRTCYQFLDKMESPVESDKLQRCIEAAISAPNHKLTQPWDFYIIGEQSKQQLAVIYAELRASKNSKNNPDSYQSLYDKAVEKFNKIPQIILMTQRIADDEVTRLEDYAACASAIENFQLMAWSMNIGMQWSTGPIINDLRSYQLLAIEQSQQQIIGALYIGNIDEDCQPKSRPKRKTAEQVSHYLK